MANCFRWPLALLAPLLVPLGAAAHTPAPLPQYDLDIRLDVAAHTVHVRERVTWTNPASRPAEQLVFNAHAHFKLPAKDVGMTAKMFEILRMMPGESLDL